MITRDETSEVPYRGNGAPSREAAAPAEQAPAREDAEDTGPPDFVGHLTEAGTHLARLARVRTDRAEHALRRRAVGLVALVFALLATSIFCIQGALLLSRGLAGTLGALAGDRPWAGELVAGVLLLAGPALLGLLAWRAHERRELRRKLHEYRHEDASAENAG